MSCKTLVSAVGVALSLQAAAAHAETPRNDGILRKALTDELGRTMQQLAIPGEAKPYFAAYTVLDSDTYVVTASRGAVLFESGAPSRSLLVSLRVGTPERDNSNAGQAGGFAGLYYRGSPLEDEYPALRRALWLAGDQEYKQAIEMLAQKKSALSVRVNEVRDSYPDFSEEPKHETVVNAKAVDAQASNAMLRGIVERLSRLVASEPNLLDSGAEGQRLATRRRFLSSEQTWADEPHHFTRVTVHASTQADDGMHLHTSLEFTGTDPATLPSIENMEARTREALARLASTRNARLADSGTAVILFEDQAAAQLVQSLLAHRLSGTPPFRYVGTDTDQTLASKLGVQVVSPLLDVFDDPSLSAAPGKEPLWGHYAADDEGVPARRVSLIERGVLKTLLMSRAPRKEIRNSNGHFRLGQGAGIGNLIVHPNKPLSRSKLLELAAREAKKQGPGTKVYVVRRLAPRHVMSGPLMPFAMYGSHALSMQHSVAAMEAFVIEDGKAQPVRGLTLERIELRALKDLLGTGGDATVLNFGQFAHASIVTPSLLIADIDVKRYETENPKPPSYPAP
jgi:TldD protein